MEEIWKDIKGYEGLYQVSNLGNVKSLEKRVNGKKCHRVFKEKQLKPIETNKGYLRVKLCHKGKISKARVHRLVAETFIEKPNLEVNHINGDKKDNRLENLEWVTGKENKEHARKLGLYNRKRRGTDDKTRT